MIKIKYSRESVCMGDDVNAGEYIITLNNKATLNDLIEILIHGGNGNERPLAFTGSSTHWIIQSNIGVLAEVSVDENYNWITKYFDYKKEVLLKDLKIEYIRGLR